MLLVILQVLIYKGIPRVEPWSGAVFATKKTICIKVLAIPPQENQSFEKHLLLWLDFLPMV